MKIRNFMFCDGVAALLDNYSNFTGEFSHWSNEVNIAVCKCSNGKFIKVPSFAIEGFNEADHPKQVLKDT